MSAEVSADWETSDVAVPTVVRATDEKRDCTTAAADAGDDVHVHGATSAFRSLRLVPPPPAQDGGSFERADPFQRQQQPSPQHALFDPNGSYAQSVSPATATAAVARYGQLDPVLLAGLENSRERLSLLKFEDQIVRFIKNPREMQLSFPPLSSYHRLIIHRLAERCCLEHQTADFNPYAQGAYDGNSARVVTLFKTPQTIIPRVLLIDLSADMQQPTVTPASAPKIMVRKRNAPRGPGSNTRQGEAVDGAKSQQRSIEDRERAYAEARARIFGEESASSSEISSSSSTPSTNGSSSATSNGTGQKFGGGTQAAGPDGSRGFARGGHGGNNSAVTQTRHRDQSPTTNDAIRGHGVGDNGLSTSSGQSHRTSGSGPAGTDGVKQQQNWKESKVLWRNREQEMNDPDFTRNHDAYRPSRDQHYGGGSGGRFNAGYYDGARSFGYQNAQPPYSGRGRGPPPLNDYTRIDPRQAPLPPPPPSDYYRQHPGLIHPPPPPPGGFTSYSPHGRGYANSAPPPPSSSQQFRRGSTGVAYNDDFPPLGR